MKIIALHDHPEWLDTVVEQQWEEWGYDDAAELKEFFETETLITSPAHTDSKAIMPKTWLMVDNLKNPNLIPDAASLAGAVTLSLNEMGKRQPPEHNPWLGYLYVEPNYRGQGVAKALTQHAVTMGKQLGYPKVYLYASDEKPRYLHWGWQPLDTLRFQGETVTVMVCPDETAKKTN